MKFLYVEHTKIVLFLCIWKNDVFLGYIRLSNVIFISVI